MNTEGYLAMDLLRLTTVGSVDDGKSTLIGRLLFDAKSIFEDQLESIKNSSNKKGDDYLNFALLTDGLRAEREQGITIDIAYRYFSTPKRKFIIADAPGHIQYTRNMVTGASTANLAIILIDARSGLTEQTKRHAYVASILRIEHLVVCVNKMDLIEFSQDLYNKVVDNFNKSVFPKLENNAVTFIPISALNGDNVVNPSQKMDWYKGNTLLNYLENVNVASAKKSNTARFPVQYVIRTMNKDNPNYRGYAGRVAEGIFKVGDEVIALPSGLKSKIKTIDALNEKLSTAFLGMSVTLTLEDELDISRGDIISSVKNLPTSSKQFKAIICWLGNTPFVAYRKYVLKLATQEVRCIIKNVLSKINVNTLDENLIDKNICMNEIVRVEINTTKAFLFDLYKVNKITGSFILIDEATNQTVAAGMII
jgi:sulfate adenylyltransferase subunit 1